MAYSDTNLRRVGYGAPATGNAAPNSVHHYTTPDAAATVEAAGYFNSAYKWLAKGDIIVAVMAFNGTPVLKHYVVTASAAGGVTVVLQATAAG